MYVDFYEHANITVLLFFKTSLGRNSNFKNIFVNDKNEQLRQKS
jgi:hypothetical protein